MNTLVGPQSLITLHYRIATEAGQELVSTFDSTPATLQLGRGELMPALEQCLVGLQMGEQTVFVLTPHQAFGDHNPALVQSIPRDALPADDSVEAMSLIEFTAPDGSKFAGLVRELSEESALMDFNHPLAGKTIRFEVNVIGIL